MTPEDQITYAITHLEQFNQVIDDYQGNGLASYQLAAYFPADGTVPCAFWYRDSRRAYLNREDPRYAALANGVRSAVRV
jgi:hypothetical protein